MKHIYKILILFLLFSGCYSNRYIIYPGVPKNNNSIVRYIYLPKSINLSDEIFEITRQHINSKEYNKLKSILSNDKIDKNSDEYFYCIGILEFFSKQYDSAIFNLRNVKNQDVIPYSQLLIIDCQYEKQRLSNNVDYSYFISSYQTISETYNLNSDLNELITQRLKLIRYTY